MGFSHSEHENSCCFFFHNKPAFKVFLCGQLVVTLFPTGLHWSAQWLATLRWSQFYPIAPVESLKLVKLAATNPIALLEYERRKVHPITLQASHTLCMGSLSDGYVGRTQRTQETFYVWRVSLDEMRNFSDLRQPPKQKTDGLFPVSGHKWMNKDIKGGR